MKNTTIRYTLIYIIIVVIYTAIYCIQNNNIVLLDSAGLGNFLSGLFAPLAFLYLFLGFRQQERALIKNQNDIKKQLNIQEQSLYLQRKERDEYEFISLPLINITITPSVQGSPNLSHTNSLEDFLKNNNGNIKIHLKNLKQDAYYFNCDLISLTPTNYTNSLCLHKNGSLNFDINLNNILGSSKKTSETLYFTNSYLSSIGIPYKHDFEVTISIDKNINTGFTYHFAQIGNPQKLSEYN